ncbi:MAG: PEP/pyruvate-binding domain-containing protein [Granulosicoccaceae bacterium]
MNKLSMTCKQLKMIIAIFALYMALPASYALAIPSPDLVINLSASVAQLLGLFSVIFGGFALKGKGRNKAGKRSRLGKLGGVLLGGIIVALVASVAANILQYTGTIDAKNARLQTNLVRKSIENGASVGDTSLKTLSFSEQLDHDRGISTDTLASWLANGDPVNIIDVRENEEYEVGSIEGAAHLRYPDVLSQSSLIPEGSNTLFLCYSGNRSSELCTEFTKQGKSCNFMVGGYEKWLTESRPLASDFDLSIDELRKLPDFKNKDTLLDTPAVHELVQSEQAEFIDLRYPADFVKGHLPGAHNITMRALTSASLAERIKALPDKPLVAACYDKRSCFYSQLVGLRLERAGKDYRGRYSVPHEYYITKSTSDRAHVAAWKQSQEQVTLASYVVEPLRSLLDWMVVHLGHYALALLAVVLMVRLLLLPLSLKAERDTMVQKSLSDQVASLKEELGEHPRAQAKATMQLYKKYKIRPIINALTSIFQLSFMLLFFSAVNLSAPTWLHNFLWLDSASLPDPMFVLPVLASALFVGVLWLQSPPKTVVKKMLFVLGGVALFWLLQGLGAAVNLYLAISMAFLIGQNALFARLGKHFGWAYAGKDKTNTIEDTGLIPLAKAHYLPESTGKKAARLGILIEEGFNVPDGFVFTSTITNRSRHGKAVDELLTKKEIANLNKIWGKLKCKNVAVRSSGANEDGADNSFAGVYDSILNIKRDGLLQAVSDVYASLSSDRSDSYSSHTDAKADFGEVDQGGVLIQKMVPAEYAGVMFTEHPNSTGSLMIELVSGLGEDLVSGNVTPDTYTFGKLTGELLDAEKSTQAPPVNMQPLIELGRQLETLFGHPQDIEWAYANKKFYLLQARDITRSVASGGSAKNIAERERRKLLHYSALSSKNDKQRTHMDADAEIFVQNELSELLPRPTHVSADLMSRLWEAGGSTDLACQALGIPYDVNYFSAPYITTIYGWTYVNKLEEKRRLGKGPGAVASFQLARNAEQTEVEFREDFLPQFQIEMLERGAIDFDKLTLQAATTLLDSWVDRFVQETYQQAELINISADFHIKTALAKLQAAKLEPTLYMTNDAETIVTKAMALLAGGNVDETAIVEFEKVFGHRAPLDYELSHPRFYEDRDLINQYIERSSTEQKQVHESVELPQDKVLSITVQRARKFQLLKEDAKHYCLLELAQIRQLLVQIDKLANLDGRVFHLNLTEIANLADPSLQAELVALTNSRVDEIINSKKLQLPTSLSLREIEKIDMLTGKIKGQSTETEFGGARVAGEQEVSGVARVITDISEIDTFKRGEILVARMTDPSWYPLFAQAKGIVTEVGGWLSHAAIVAREYDLPAIVGVKGICTQINTGDVVTLKLDGSVEISENRREEASPMRREQSMQEQKPFVASDDTIIEFYRLTEAKIARINKGNERRALKDRLSDRRSELRITASGDAELDRRAANRAANSATLLKKAS